MAINQKHVFWEALIVAVFIFGIGFIFGLILENYWSDEGQQLYLDSDLHLLDVRTMSEVLNYIDVNCNLAIEQNILFGDKIYDDAARLANYEESAKLTNDLVEQHKRYDLLRTIFWINSIKIKDKCGEKFHTVVYLYDYQSEDVEEKSKQYILSKFGEELKAEFGNKVVLIPLAKDLDLDSLTLLMKNYRLNQTGVFIDETAYYYNIEDLNKAKEYLRSKV